MKLLRAYPYFCTETELRPVGESSRDIRVNASRIYFAQKPVRRLLVFRDDNSVPKLSSSAWRSSSAG